MPVHVTRRRSGIWYARGTVRVGDARVIVAEFSTGCPGRADAEAAAAARDQEIRQELIAGPGGRSRRLTIADCLLAYDDRPGGIKPYDQARVEEFSALIGAVALSEAETGWRRWLAERGAEQKPASIARWRATLQAALNHGAKAHGTQAPRLPSVRATAEEERMVYLTPTERRAMLASYNPFAACPALLLAYQGLRTQEALRLDWRTVDMGRRTLFIPASEAKTRRGRTVPMHPRVDALLFGIWNAAGRPDRGPVFLSQRRAPYADTRGRGEREQGGNPLAQAHATACERAGVTGFRVHDWRHDWAARMVMAGVDLETLRRLGGWSSLRMVQRYASVSIEHMAEAVRRLA
jgi:integrase